MVAEVEEELCTVPQVTVQLEAVQPDSVKVAVWPTTTAVAPEIEQVKQLRGLPCTTETHKQKKLSSRPMPEFFKEKGDLFR
jgi:hypothetical protein